ncbi:hypothetical protein Skr01_06880 [Sphaerisporangium krabiense]|nr:hypothetical protein Skr01_06880 [Sphaerisporangium krabiense]
MTRRLLTQWHEAAAVPPAMRLMTGLDHSTVAAHLRYPGAEPDPLIDLVRPPGQTGPGCSVRPGCNIQPDRTGAFGPAAVFNRAAP